MDPTFDTDSAYVVTDLGARRKGYVLIDPDGHVLMEDRTQPGPSLRVFKLELTKQQLDGRQ